MNLRMVRKESRPDGIFSELFDEGGNLIAHTLEHAYDNGSGGFSPKIPAGRFTCVRGQHRLHGMTDTFTTFEITGIEGHTNLLFHSGNFNRDSEGCILVGSEEADLNGQKMITASKAAFKRLMDLEEKMNEFQLTVEA